MKSRKAASDPKSGSPKNICPGCDGSLTIHQPAPDFPHRFLGVCEDCKSWFFLGTRTKTVRLLIAFRTRNTKAGDS
jgi:hypothetical protein